MHLRKRGFSFVEMVLAVGLLAVTILATGLLAMTMLRSQTESNDRISAVAVCNTLLDQTLNEAQADSAFWTGDHSVTPYKEDTVKMGKLEYQYQVFAQTVVDTAGDEVGTALTDNRLKRVTIQLTWFDTESEERQGYGKLKESITRIVNQNP